MLISIITAVATSALAVNAAIHQVAVGQGGLVYSPNTTIAAVGDTVVFSFYPINHNVVQGPYDSPCMSGNKTGIYSGFISSMMGVANRTFQITINNTDPIWYYCSQRGGGGHCTRGMAGVINPPNSTEMTLANYVAAAANVANTSYSEPSGVQQGVVVTNTSSTSPTSSTTSPASSSSAATPTTTRSAAAGGHAVGWRIGALAGVLAVVLY